MLVNKSLIDNGLEPIGKGQMVNLLTSIANIYISWEMTDYDYTGPSLGEELRLSINNETFDVNELKDAKMNQDTVKKNTQVEVKNMEQKNDPCHEPMIKKNLLDQMFLNNIIEFQSHMLRTKECPPQKEYKKLLIEWFNDEEVDDVRSFLKNYCILIETAKVQPIGKADETIIRYCLEVITKKIAEDDSPTIQEILLHAKKQKQFKRKTIWVEHVTEQLENVRIKPLKDLVNKLDSYNIALRESGCQLINYETEKAIADKISKDVGFTYDKPRTVLQHNFSIVCESHSNDESTREESIVNEPTENKECNMDEFMSDNWNHRNPRSDMFQEIVK